LRKKLTVVVAMALMLAMMLASAGTALAVPGGEHGQGAAHATNANAQFGLGVAITHNFSGGGCDVGC
jgi:hypothetical protein